MYRWVLKLPYIFIFTLSLVIPVQSDSLRILSDQDFILRVGQRAKLDDALTIMFTSILGDSRCPINVTCVWAGNGRVELEIFDTEGSPMTVQLNTERGPKIKALKKYQLQLLSLNPPRVDGVNIAPGDYSVTLRIIEE